MNSEDLILNQIVFCSQFFVTFDKLLALNNAKLKHVLFCIVLLSIFRNFAQNIQLRQ